MFRAYIWISNAQITLIVQLRKQIRVLMMWQSCISNIFNICNMLFFCCTEGESENYRAKTSNSHPWFQPRVRNGVSVSPQKGLPWKDNVLSESVKNFVGIIKRLVFKLDLQEIANHYSSSLHDILGLFWI